MSGETPEVETPSEPTAPVEPPAPAEAPVDAAPSAPVEPAPVDASAPEAPAAEPAETPVDPEPAAEQPAAPEVHATVTQGVRELLKQLTAEAARVATCTQYLDGPEALGKKLLTIVKNLEAQLFPNKE